jgi:S-formylglutathione hydrolase FrmB
VLAAVASTASTTGTATAAVADGSSIVGVTHADGRHLTLAVHSAAMNRTIPVTVQTAARSGPAPVLYLLNGLDAGLSDASWNARTHVLDFLADKNVTVVEPIGGYASYYTDWRAPDPRLGLNKWRTFLVDELPPLIDAQLHANGRNAIAGTSMSATSVLQLAEADPHLYRAVAAYSGCAEISDPVGYNFVKLVVQDRARGRLVNMYGPEHDPLWAANDPYLHADRLRGVDLFVSSGSGLPGPHDNDADPHTLQGPGAGATEQMIVGGAIEAAANMCTHNFAARLAQLRIPATFDFTPTGTHSWGYWEDAFYASWPVLARGLGLEG